MSSIDIPSTSGIYRITCIPTGKIYIGSASNLRIRCSRHLTDLRFNRHCNQKLQRAYQKHGEAAFVFDVLELVLTPELLTAREQYWFNTLKPFGNKGFNIDRVAGSALGRKMSPEACTKISTARKGKPNPHPGNNYSNLGKKLSPEHCAKISASSRGKPGVNLGKKYSPEHCAKIGAANRGKKRSPELSEQIRLAKLGNTNKAKNYIVTSPEGVEYTVYNLAAFCREHHLCKANLGQVAKGRRKHHKGWIARYA